MMEWGRDGRRELEWRWRNYGIGTGQRSRIWDKVSSSKMNMMGKNGVRNEGITKGVLLGMKECGDGGYDGYIKGSQEYGNW